MPSPPADDDEYTDQHRNCLLDRVQAPLDQSVIQHVNLELHHNVTYDQSDLLDLLTHISLHGEFATNGAKTRRVAAGERTAIRSDDRSPLAKALG